MIVLNYAHPLTSEQRAQIAALVGAEAEIRNLPLHIDRAMPLADVARALADDVGLDGEQWQTLPIVVNPPGLAPLALALLAEMHGRRGDFVPVLNIRPVLGSLPMRYEVAEVVDLQSLRLNARKRWRR